MFTAIVCHGPNDVEIPSIVFENKESAYIYLEKMVQCQIDRSKTEFYIEMPDNDDDDDHYLLGFYENDGIVFIGEPFHINKLVTHYYGGCGEIYKIEIREVEFGKPFIGWDLD